MDGLGPFEVKLGSGFEGIESLVNRVWEFRMVSIPVSSVVQRLYPYGRFLMVA